MQKGVKPIYDKSMEYVSQTQTLIGSQRKRLIDEDTGERIEVDQITKRALGQKQFWKIYLMDFLQVLGVLDSKQIDILIYILENTEASNNTFIGTYSKIQEAVKVSRPTVATVMRKLQGNGFVKRIQNGVWQVSANIMMKGSEHKKSLLLNYYDDSQQLDQPEPEQTEDPRQQKRGKANDERRVASHSNHDGNSNGQQVTAHP